MDNKSTQTSRKRILTEQVRDLLQDEGYDYDRTFVTVWHNLRSHTGFRLTDRGYDIFEHRLTVKSYYFLIGDVGGPLMFMYQLEKKLQSPYYLHHTRNRSLIGISLFGGEEAMWLTMYDGDLKKFLESY